MDFQNRKMRAFDLMSRNGMTRQSYAPPLFRLLWKLGAKVRPPHFMGFGAVTAAFGAWFAFGWGTVMWLAVWSRNGASLLFGATTAVFAGLCFGLINAFVIRRQRAKYGLPTWESLREHENPDDAATPALHR